MNHQYCAEYARIRLRPLHIHDIERLRKWRNDAQLSRYFTPMPYITRAMQSEWYHNYLEKEDTIFFAVEDKEDGKMMGTVALYDFNGTSCEAGKIIIGDSTKRGQGFGQASMLMALWIGISELGMDCFTLRVYEENKAAYHIYLKIGFTETGRECIAGDISMLHMGITRAQFQSRNSLQDKVSVYLEKTGGRENI